MNINSYCELIENSSCEGKEFVDLLGKIEDITKKIYDIDQNNKLHNMHYKLFKAFHKNAIEDYTAQKSSLSIFKSSVIKECKTIARIVSHDGYVKCTDIKSENLISTFESLVNLEKALNTKGIFEGIFSVDFCNTIMRALEEQEVEENE